MSTDQADKPSPMLPDIEAAIRTIADTQGMSPEDLLARVDRRINDRMAEDRPQCLLPDDLIDYQRFGELRPLAEAHRKQCAACNQLLQASVPDWSRILEIRKRVAASVRLNQQLAGAAGTGAWTNWRVPVAGMTLATIICVVALNRPPSEVNSAIAQNDNQDKGVVLQATAKPGEAPAVPVSVRLRTINGTSITVTDSDVAVAASTAALAKNPPAFTLPPYGWTDPSPDVSHREATEKTIALIAKVVPAWASGQDHQALVTEAAAQLDGVEFKSLDSKGQVHLAFSFQNGVVNTDFNLARVVATASRYGRIIDRQWLNTKVSSAKPIKLDKEISIEMIQMLPPNKNADSAVARNASTAASSR